MFFDLGKYLTRIKASIVLDRLMRFMPIDLENIPCAASQAHVNGILVEYAIARLARLPTNRDLALESN